MRSMVSIASQREGDKKGFNESKSWSRLLSVLLGWTVGVELFSEGEEEVFSKGLITEMICGRR